MNGVQVLSYELTRALSSESKLKKILEIVKTGDIVMLEGKLTSEEETTLISRALKNVSGKFSGIEIAFLGTHTSKTIIDKIKEKLLNFIAQGRFGITVIGPSKKIKEIKMDPQKLEILLK